MLRQPLFLFATILVMALVCASSIWLIPVGHGPFPAVYGPMSALRAHRAALLLLYSISAIFAAMIGFALASLFSADRRKQSVHPAPTTLSLTGLSLVCVFRC